MTPTSDEPKGKETEFQSESVSDARRKMQGGFMPGENRVAAQFFRTTDKGYAMFHLNCLDNVKSPDAFAEVLSGAVMENNKLTVFRASSRFMTVEELNTPCRICGRVGALNRDDPPEYVPPEPKPPAPTERELMMADKIRELEAQVLAASSPPETTEKSASGDETHTSDKTTPPEKPHVHRYGKSGKCRCGKSKVMRKSGEPVRRRR